MREIKFRAWLKKENRMLKNCCLLNALNGVAVCNELDFENDKGICSLFYDAEIMQYTGLKDKNGKEIYEGDIIGGLKGYKGKDLTLVVEFEYGAYYVGGDELYSHNEVCEVIGNIYENPELLEERSKIEKI